MAGKNGKIRQYRKPLNINLGIIIFSVIFIYVVICVFLYFTQKQIQPYEVRTGSLSVDSVYRGNRAAGGDGGDEHGLRLYQLLCQRRGDASVPESWYAAWTRAEN